MPTMRAQVVLQGTSNKPEDVFVNTFHFLTTAGGIGDATAIKDALVELYNTVPPGTGLRALCADITQFVSRAANASKVKVYNLADPKPRIPFTFDWQLGASLNSTAMEMPAEVAICASFYATLNRPRYRGRVYFGPWTLGISDDDGTTNRAKPSVVLRDSVAATMKRLVDKPNEVFELAVYSTVDAIARKVTNGWVDDAWDVQRRRGQDAANRTVWAAA